jgi:hypothetical protein
MKRMRKKSRFVSGHALRHTESKNDPALQFAEKLRFSTSAPKEAAEKLINRRSGFERAPGVLFPQPLKASPDTNL